MPQVGPRGRLASPSRSFSLHAECLLQSSWPFGSTRAGRPRWPWVRWHVARRAEEASADASLIVVINEDQPVMDRAEWLRLLEADGETDLDIQAAEVVRELREHCEGDDPGRP